ncbi:MAG: hypothetical protein B6I20_10555 [Bacteroidetes bacterium 4572_117]|nr:MAG: hypothetical protein B6I20_10555 [Bacteroidetes bacterium 4572_117]
MQNLIHFYMAHKLKILITFSLIIVSTIVFVFAKTVNPSYTVSDTTGFVNEKREYLEHFIKENNIDGLAIAFFTKNEIIWKECLGKSTYNKPINDSTLFGICSVSKNITALTVMFAVQERLVDLDTPIIKYLPDFTVNSCYEESPAEKITLRMMLSHTAGFSHEAPIGNNIDYRCNSKQEHWNSINDTWLKFPVNTKWAYSGNGFDLASKIIEKVSGISFETYVKEKIFFPLDMKYSTFSDNEVINNDNRTEGVVNPYVKINHKKIPVIGAGGAYSNIEDMVKYVQFQMNLGELDNKQLLEKKYLFQMYTINKNFYGLGTWIVRPNDNDILKTFYLSHSGEGFGYGSTMLWFPEYGIGCVILGAKPFNYNDIAENITTEYILNNDTILNNKNLNIGYTPVFNPDEKFNQKFDFVYPKNEKKSIAYKKESIIGKYELILDNTQGKWFTKIVAFLGIKVVTVKVSQKEGKLLVDGMLGNYKLEEYIPGLYFSDDGEVFDIRNSVPTFKNIKLRKYSDK